MKRLALEAIDTVLELPVITNDSQSARRRLPPWMKRPLPGLDDFGETRRVVADSGVATVCQEARCPNLSECWAKRHATFMILGEKCTRRCHYCAVETARPDLPSPDEPQRLAEAVARLGLAHVVITAVARDDLQDEGAAHFAACVRAIRDAISDTVAPDTAVPDTAVPDTTIEVLPADFHARESCIRALVEAGPDLYNHNLEMVERLTPQLRPQGKYARSLDVLRIVKTIDPDMLTKSGLMVGLGETREELVKAFADLREVDCDVLTVGQYLRPTRDGHAPVEKYYPPEEFDHLADTARAMGFLSVAAGPFVRSSYNAAEVFAKTRTARATCAGRTPAGYP